MKKLIVLCLALAIVFSMAGCQSKNDRLSVEGVKENFNSENHTAFLVTIGSESNYDSIDALSQMLCFNEWSKTDKTANETLRLTVEISEEYEIRIYDSYIHIYDGYALIGQSDSEYYAISETMDEQISAYIITANNN